MRNKEQEIAWQKVIKACMEAVKNHFADIVQCIEFGTYIQPENYFVSYIFSHKYTIRCRTAKRADRRDQFLSQRAAEKASLPNAGNQRLLFCLTKGMR